MSAAAARSRAGAAATPRDSEQAHRDTLIGIEQRSVPLAGTAERRDVVPSPAAAANAPSPPPAATPTDREQLPIVGYDDLSAK
jgi:hypothetical protein